GSPNMLGAVALEASLSLLEEVGMHQVAASLNERMEWLRAGLRQLPGIELLSPAQPERSAGIVTFRLAGSANQALFEQLKAEQVVCALRGGGIRLSPHFYTPAEVIEDTLALLRNLAG
ncbi:MAG TPA: aminotransferase, partial [Pseudomonas sp.]|nr:aminotransferase [Pseudomonas sp.]